MDACRIERFRQIAQRYLALVLIAMRAVDQQRGWAVAVLQHDNRDRDEAVGRAVDGMEQSQEALLTAVLVEIDLGDNATLPGSGHVSPPADLRRACRSAILASGSNKLKGGDPVSHCLIVAPFTVAWISDARVAV